MKKVTIIWSLDDIVLQREPKSSDELGLSVAPIQESGERYYTHPNSNAFISWD